jgi:hypothetical protein
MRDKSQTFKNLDPPSDIPPLRGGFQPQPTKNLPPLQATLVLEAIESDVYEKVDCTNPNVFKTPLYALNQGQGPLPMIPEGPQSLNPKP